MLERKLLPLLGGLLWLWTTCGACGHDRPASSTDATPAPRKVAATNDAGTGASAAASGANAASAASADEASKPTAGSSTGRDARQPTPTTASPATRRAPTAVGGPAGRAAYADFQGKRIGLVHTANVIGEVDPCG